MKATWSFTRTIARSFMALLVFIIWWTNAELELVTSNDYIEFYSQTGAEIIKQEIAGFKNYQSFNLNNTIKGNAWYYTGPPKINEDFINSNWLQKDNSTSDFVLIIPFDNQNFVNNLNLINQSYKRFKGIVFTYKGNPQITSGAPKSDIPSIISFAKEEIVQEKNIESYSYPKSTNYKIVHSHTYIEHWDVMIPANKFYIVSLCLWVLSTIVHIFWTWWIKKDYSTHLQKIILFVPIFFLGYTLIDYVFYNACPWNQNSGVQYLQIVQIAMITIFNTLFVGLCLFISKGWSIMRSTFTREELSSITMIVGIFYLVYSAYFIASDIPSLKVVIIIILIIMYLWVAITWVKNCIVNIRTLRSHILITGSEEIIMDSLKLKKSLMVNFWIVTLLFYANKIVFSGLFTFINDNVFWRNLIVVNLFVELFIVWYMLIVFRSRKWPEYFSLDILYRQIGNHDDEGDHLPKSIIMNAILPSSWAIGNSKSDVIINGKEVKDHKHKHYQDPEVALIIEGSEIEPQSIQKLTHLEVKYSLYSEVKLAIQEQASDSSDSE